MEERLRVGVLEEDEVYGRGVMAVLNEDGCVCIDLGGDRERSPEAADADPAGGGGFRYHWPTAGPRAGAVVGA